MRKRTACRFPEENGNAENYDVSVRGRGNEVLRFRARAMGREGSYWDCEAARKDFIALASNKRPGTDETLTVRMKATRKQKGVLFEEKANTWKLEDGEVSNRRAGYELLQQLSSRRLHYDSKIKN